MGDEERLEAVFNSIDEALKRQDYFEVSRIFLENLEYLAEMMNKFIEDGKEDVVARRLGLKYLLRFYRSYFDMISYYVNVIFPMLRQHDIDLLATNAAHQLKQPVGVIRAATSGALHDLKDGMFSPETELEPLLEKILRQTARMSAIIDGVSERARADLSLHAELDLNDVISEALDTNFADEFRTHGLALRCERADAPLRVYANRIALENVLIHLVANARDALAGRGDGEVVVTLSAGENGWSAFAVRDNGAGVSESIKKQLFAPFTSTKPTEQGMGMGLYLAKTAVEKMGGTLTYDDQHQPGARFVVRLPPAADQRMKEEQHNDA